MSCISHNQTNECLVFHINQTNECPVFHINQTYECPVFHINQTNECPVFHINQTNESIRQLVSLARVVVVIIKLKKIGPFANFTFVS